MSLNEVSSLAGADQDDLQRRAYISQGVSEEFNLDKQIDMLSDTQEKIGEALSEGSFNKEGEFTGGGGAGDLINALVRSGALEANKQSVEAYFADADKNMGVMIDRIFADVNKNIHDQGKRRFVLESLASDLGKLNNAMNQNREKVNQLTKSYEENNIGLTDEDITRLQKVDSMFATISTSMSNFSLKFYNGFTKAFGEDTQGKLSEFFDTLMKLAEPLGYMLGLAIQPFLNRLILLTKALSAIVDGVKWAIEAFNTVSNKIREFGANVLNMFSNLADKIKGALVGMLPSWMQSDDKKQSNDSDSNDVNNTNNINNSNSTHNIDNSNTDKSVINNKSESIENYYNPYAQTAVGSYKMNLGTFPTIPAPSVPTVPTVPTMPKVVPPQPTAASTQQMNNVNNNNVTVNPVVNTTVELDGETIANAIGRTSGFQNNVLSTMHPLMIGGL
ncbi:hypothetical protein [Vibrio casei]|uniref:hypothetical protein n=3 Tax=Vibrio TaxID=662 RepID=UPI000DA6844C|nr:hypothetical protein [Vibrio casei]